jgi:hypothetical protein
MRKKKKKASKKEKSIKTDQEREMYRQNPHFNSVSVTGNPLLPKPKKEKNTSKPVKTTAAAHTLLKS